MPRHGGHCERRVEWRRQAHRLHWMRTTPTPRVGDRRRSRARSRRLRSAVQCGHRSRWRYRRPRLRSEMRRPSLRHHQSIALRPHSVPILPVTRSHRPPLHQKGLGAPSASAGPRAEGEAAASAHVDSAARKESRGARVTEMPRCFAPSHASTAPVPRRTRQLDCRMPCECDAMPSEAWRSSKPSGSRPQSSRAS